MKAFFFCLILLSATPLSQESSPRAFFVVWNIGQGQWTTWIKPRECWHFDMGGEFFPWRQIRAACGDKLNRVFLSHWDLDHIGALRKAPRYLPQLCLASGPVGPGRANKESLLPTKLCPPDREDSPWQWRPTLKPQAASNELSQVFVAHGFLIPGDSTRKEEPTWAPLLPARSIHYLVLGHHGSRTSTSDFLLDRLPGLKLAISSARWKRYRHPHPETLARLRLHRVPVLRTEEWGSLWFEI